MRDLRRADFSHADVSNGDFRGCDLSDATFVGATMLSARFDGANMTRVNCGNGRAGRAWPQHALVETVFFVATGFFSFLFTSALSALFAGVLRGGTDGLAYGAASLVALSITYIFTGRGTSGLSVIAGIFGVALLVAFASFVLVFAAGPAAGAVPGAVASGVAVGLVGITTVSLAVCSVGSMTGALAGACAGMAAGTLANSVAGAFDMAGRVALALVRGLGEVQSGASIVAGLWATGIFLISYHHARSNDSGFASLKLLQVRVGAFGGTSFHRAVLANADMSGCELGRSNFGMCDMTRTTLGNCRSLDRAWPGDDRWQDPKLCKLLTERNGEQASLVGRSLAGANLTGANLRQADLSHADLSGATMEGADLHGANLAEVQALGTCLQNANLTGACLRDWNVDDKTDFRGLQCEYFFLLEREDARGNRDRRPHQTTATFPPGTVEKLLSDVRDTIQLMLKNSGSRGAFNTAFLRVMKEYPEITPELVHSVKRVADMWVVTLQAPKDIDKQGVANTFDRTYHQALDADAKNRPELQKGKALPGENALVPITEMRPAPARARIFVSYAHRDEDLLHEFLPHTAALRREGLVDFWHDREIRPGESWQDRIDDHLLSADLILLLVSHHFINSDYCFQREMAISLERHTKCQARVIPILLRPCDWKSLSIGALQALPKDALPITSWPNRDDAWLDVIRGIRQTIVDLQELRERTGG